MIMKPTVITNNKIFIYAIAGVLFFIAALGYALTNLSNIVTFELSSFVIVSTLSFLSFSLLFKAIKNDKNRFKEVQG